MFGVVVFQDLVLAEVEGIPDDLDIQRFVYDDLRFYLDRLSIAWLALGTILAVSMTILWTAPIASFQMAYEERVFWAVYMVFCFATVSLIVVLFVGYPIIGRMRRIRDGISTRQTQETKKAGTLSAADAFEATGWRPRLESKVEITLKNLEPEQAAPPFYADKAKLLAYQRPDGKTEPIEDAAGWEKRRSHILANAQLVMGPLPDRSDLAPPEVEVLESVELSAAVRKRVTYLSEPGDRIPAYLTIPKGIDGKAPAMLCLHQTTPIGKAEPVGLGGKPNLRYAQEMAERGYVTLAPDYPNYGDYSFDPYDHGYESATMKGIRNHMRAVDLLQSLPEVDRERIGCIGHSLGGHNTIYVGVFDTRIKAMVSSCGFTASAKYKGGDLTGWSHNGYMPRIASVYGKDPARMPFDFTELIAALAPRAFFANSPVADGNFELSGVKDCIAAAAPVYELFGARDRLAAVHPDVGHDFPPEIREQAYEFIDDVLRR